MTDAGGSEADSGAVFERALDRALGLDRVTQALARRPGGLGREDLRSGAWQARGEIMATARAERAETSLLAPRVSALAGLVLLLSGYGVRSLGGRPYVGDGLIMAGVLICAVAVGAAVGDFIWLLVKASTRRDDEPDRPGTAAAGEPALLDAALESFLLRRIEGPPGPALPDDDARTRGTAVG
ncbi:MULTISPECIES: hypothetical protein [Streptomyces]|jgi:hypothetical protein|uniref:Uncharacterized protein n=1 Tax=Streptomyces doudnae TaxID=3075536 RepID=A0ABD5EGD9_9ACTN|nr:MULTISPECIES: hypothetical protein [unclassified Streptomyces]MDT0433675.1 hypothetical protein [Streptomyces sp. DSM 41981]MYQ63186.1 hypothetical protein [Streptomyces sp. SID4950]